MDIAVAADHRVKLKEKLKESEKKDKYLDLTRKLQETVKCEIVISALGIVTKRLLKGLEDLKIRGRVETI